MKKAFLISLIFSATTFLVFEAHQGNTYAQNEGAKAVNVGNKICPVTGGEVDGKTTYEYQGKIYNFCCPACIDEFKKNPEKYIKKVGEELKGESKPIIEEQKTIPESGSGAGEHSGHQH